MASFAPQIEIPATYMRGGTRKGVFMEGSVRVPGDSL